MGQLLGPSELEPGSLLAASWVKTDQAVQVVSWDPSSCWVNPTLSAGLWTSDLQEGGGGVDQVPSCSKQGELL